MSSVSGARVAILLATYNGAEFIAEFFDSLYEQTFKDFVIYARDDGSTDCTLQLIQSYSSKLEIVLLPSKERLGPARSFFDLMQRVEADFDCYMLADQDDVWYRDKIERAVDALSGLHNGIGLYCTRLEYVDRDLRRIALSRRPRLLSLRNAVVENVATGCSVAITARAKEEMLQRHPHDFIMHDWWMYMFCAAFGKVIYDPEPSIKYRQHGSNTIGAPNGFLDDLQRRWGRFTKRTGGVHLLSRQAKAFLACYGDKLSVADRKMLETVVGGTTSFSTRLQLSICPPVTRQMRLDTFIMRFLFLIGRY
ncbi:glycosyltransferase family 2 protein [Rhizobium sp. 1399]|uniref:glycosyltransferase family 2 protein n=1 Tax=Rhizobium sp. 1399 TaxID=2817758 RepID=UPI00285ECB65|nr:glycosyltransferase family 2 protein [Rhizobium sp. 1399]MDR6671376.1 glycosyltransferase involved in cell wall biosynthesis [Rhizobium sp. 1399]